jgi:hypothetical protein
MPLFSLLTQPSTYISPIKLEKLKDGKEIESYSHK